MRFGSASILFIVTGFIFLIVWAVMSLFLDEVHSAMSAVAPAEALGIINLLPTAFGVICAIFITTGVVLVFVMDSLQDEPEMYWRQ